MLLIKSIASKEEEDPVESHPTPGYKDVGKSMDYRILTPQNIEVPGQEHSGQYR